MSNLIDYLPLPGDLILLAPVGHPDGIYWWRLLIAVRDKVNDDGVLLGTWLTVSSQGHQALRHDMVLDSMIKNIRNGNAAVCSTGRTWRFDLIARGNEP